MPHLHLRERPGAANDRGVEYATGTLTLELAVLPAVAGSGNESGNPAVVRPEGLVDR